MEHIDFIIEMVTRGLQHISIIKDMILPDLFLSHALHSHKTQTITGWIFHFLEY